MEEAEESTQIQRNQIRARGRRLKPRSKVWEHFTRETGDDGNEKAKCNRCDKVYAYYGTKNLWEYYNEGCGGGQESADAGAAEQPPQPLPSLAQDEEAMKQQLPLLPPCAPSRHGGSSDRESSGRQLQEEAWKHLARMIALGGYDASFLEDDCFRSFVTTLNPEFEVPSRIAIENMCDGICDEARRDLLDRLRRAPGKVNLAVGRAKTMEEQVLYVVCHFIDDGWNLQKLLLHAIVTTDHHDDGDGPILGLDVCIFAIAERAAIVTADQHDINDRLFMVAYDTTVEDVDNARTSFCSQLGLSTFVDKVLHSVARCLRPSDDFIADHVLNGTTDLLLTRQGRLELLAELDLHYGWAYDEHWYACYCALEVLSKKGFPGQLTDAKLANMTKLLCKLWQKIYRAIQKISSSPSPTANLCLAELLELRGNLQPEQALEGIAAIGHTYGFSEGRDVRDVLREASDTLDEAIEDTYQVWSLALAMDPRYKLKYLTFNFERAYGLETAKEYVSKVTTMITEMYVDYVEEYGTADGANHADSANAMDTTTSADDTLEQAWNEHCRSQQGMATQVSSSCYHPEADDTELDRYLKDPLASHHSQFDILNWWKDHSSEYPMVARMARDALAMPTCSKLSSDQMAQVRSILRAYSKKPYGANPKEYMSI